MVATRIDDEYAEYAHSTGLPTIVYNPLAGGLLTDKHTDHAPDTGRFGTTPLGAVYRNRYWNDTVLNAITELRSIAEQAGLPTAELALRWAISRPAVNGALIGGSRRKHPCQHRRGRERATPDRPSRRRHHHLYTGARADADLQPVTPSKVR